MKLATGIEMLEISATVMGKVDTLNPTLFWDEKGAVLVDACYPGQLELIRTAVEQAGVPFEQIHTILITHQDLDHIGSLPSLLQALPEGVKVLATEIEKPYIQGEKRLLKLTPEAIAQVDAMFPPNVPEEWRNAFRALLQNPPKANVDAVIADGEVIPVAGGVTVINTPGHTPGHVSLYHHASKTLVAADALIVADGQLQGPEPQYCADLEQAMKSVKRFMELEIDAVICYHGGVYRGNVKERLAEILKGE